MSEVKLVPLGNINSAIVDYLAMTMPDNLGTRFEILNAKINLSDVYDRKRQQYNSTKILLKLMELNTHADCKVLGITDVDLFIPIFTFVFGEAQLGGRVALVSTYRLRQQFYGLPEDRSLFYTRCEKETAHELGHTFGLRHCSSYECVMYFSNSIEQVDIKLGTFCPSCQSLFCNLDGKIRFND